MRRRPGRRVEEGLPTIEAMDRFDVCVRGCGAVGTSMALALARQGLQVAITRPRESAADRSDVRAYALNAASRALLSDLKVWDALPADAVTPVHEMRVAGDAPAGAIEFSSWQQAVDALAWIVDAAELEAVLLRAIGVAPHVRVVPSPVPAALTVWAEGKSSAAGDELGVHVQRHAYGHTAVAARLTCERPHAHTAWQWFRSPDVLALLPLDRPEAGRSFAMVWSQPQAQAQAAVALDDGAFEQRLNEVAAPTVGALRLAGPRVGWPLSLVRAEPLCGAGWVLVGDAAHVVHPLAGQGLNLGLADVRSLASVIARRESWRCLGDPVLLHRHVRARTMPIAAMAGLTDGLLHLFSSELPLVRELRNRGMGWVNRVAPIKRLLTARALDA